MLLGALPSEPGETYELAKVALDPMPRWSVRVVDGGAGQPLANARLSLHRKFASDAPDPIGSALRWNVPRTSFAPFEWSGTTDARGLASVPVSAGAEYDALVEHDGFAPLSTPFVAAIGATDAQTPTTWTLSQGATVRVHCRDEANGRIWAAAQVSEVWVEPEPPNGSSEREPRLRSTRLTDEQGIALFDRLPSGKHVFALADDDREAEHVKLQLHDGDALEVSLVRRERVRLTGTIREEGRALVAAQLGLGPGGPRDAFTDRLGRFTIEGLYPGSAELQITHPRRGVVDFLPLELQAPETQLDLDLVLSDLSGTIRDRSGAPVEGAELALESLNDASVDSALGGGWGPPLRGAESDRRGEFHLAAVHLRPGLFLRARHAGFVTVRRPLPVPREDEPPAPLELVLPEAARLEVEVTGPPGGKWNVVARWQGNEQLATNEAQTWSSVTAGRARFDALQPGPWTMTVEGTTDERALASETVTVSAGDNPVLVLVVPPVRPSPR